MLNMDIPFIDPEKDNYRQRLKEISCSDRVSPELLEDVDHIQSAEMAVIDELFPIDEYRDVRKTGVIDTFPIRERNEAWIADVILESGLNPVDALAVSLAIARGLAEDPDMESVTITDVDSEGEFGRYTQDRENVDFLSVVDDESMTLSVEEYQQRLRIWRKNLGPRGSQFLPSDERAVEKYGTYIGIGRALLKQAQ
jgi:hypothetical protein